jgi:hypothetical protein
VHSLLRAALYESVDLAERSAAVLAELSPHDGEGGDLRISAPIPCESIEGLGRYRPIERRRFRPGEPLRLYAEVFGLRNERIGGLHCPQLEVQVALIDHEGRERDRTTIATETSPAPDPVVDSFLMIPYTLPREAAFGEARLVLTVKDLISGAEAQEERRLTIAP